MKQYGAQVATSFSTKQVNVVFANAKSGNIKVEKWFISELYALADFYGYDDNNSVANSERTVLDILDAVFGKRYEEAQALINEAEDEWYNAYGKKNQSKCDRTVYVA